MVDWIVMLGFQVLVLVLAVVLLQGKGAWLIAGFNMLPNEKKRLVDWHGLCRFMGKIMLGVALACALHMGYLYTEALWMGIMAAVVLISSVVLALLWTYIRYLPSDRIR